MRDEPAICSCAALRQAARHVTRLYDKALAPEDLGLNQYAVLAKLERHGPHVLQDLADLLVMDRSSLGHLLRPLEQRGLVAIRIAADDKRRREIALSDTGRALVRRAKPRWRDAEARFEAAFGAREAAALRAVLSRIATLELTS